MTLVMLENGNIRVELDGRVWYLNESQVRKLRSELNRALQKYAEVKSADLKALRDSALERDGGCRWPGCIEEIHYSNPLEMAHLSHRGMGGRTSVNVLSEVVMLCKIHHDYLDGRTGLGILRLELNRMLRSQIGTAFSTE